jgi:transposase-like protein
MKKKRQTQYTNTLKAKVALEAIREERTLAQIASDHDIIVKNIYNWKKHALDNFEELFSRSSVLDYQEQLERKQSDIDELHKKLGELVVERDWLKKKARQAGILE